MQVEFKSSLNLFGNNTFTANWAGSRGGGIYAQETNISFSGTGLLSGNKAQLDGGGIYADGSNLNFSAILTISSNTAQLGGGIYLDNDTFNIDGPSVYIAVYGRNVAEYYGGGIYTQRTLLILAGNNMFDVHCKFSRGTLMSKFAIKILCPLRIVLPVLLQIQQRKEGGYMP